MTGSEILDEPTADGRTPNVALWAVQVLLATLFAFAGLNKVFGHQQEMLDQFAKMGPGPWFRYFTGAIELSGAIGLLIPQLSGLAATCLAGVMVGAVFIHLFVLPPVAVALAPAVVGVVLGLVAWGRRPQTRALAGQLGR